MRFRLWMCGLAALVLTCDLAQAGRQRSRCRSSMSSCSAPACGCSPTCACQPCECGGLASAIADGCVRSKSVTLTSSTDCAGGTCRSKTVTTTRGSTAQWKADQLAARGQLVHLGGSFGGGSYEGIGFGATADQATRACCYWGQRTPIEIGTAQGANGWYAVVLYR